MVETLVGSMDPVFSIARSAGFMLYYYSIENPVRRIMAIKAVAAHSSGSQTTSIAVERLASIESFLRLAGAAQS